MMKQLEVKTVNRETWLEQANAKIQERIFDKACLNIPEDVKISVGYPLGFRGGSKNMTVGVCHPRSHSDAGVNEIFINPDRETKAQDNFKIIAITEDDDTILLDSDNQFEIDTAAINDKNIAKPPSEKYLILGWNNNTLVMLENLNSYAAPGSSVEVIISDKIVDV